MNVITETVGPWGLSVERGKRYLHARASLHLPGKWGNVAASCVGETPVQAIANTGKLIDPIAGDLAGDIADTFARMFDELEAAAAPPADTVVDRFERWKAAGCPPVDERGLYLEQGPADI
ncbi:MAG: hypothetical protein ACWGPR_10795 [Candidatus Deferrimicrobiaceae bacterium]